MARFLTPRARRALALLDRLDEYVEDRASVGRDEFETPAGFAPSYKRCEHCLGTGFASGKDPFGRRRCPECDGEGQVRVRSGGELDPYETGTAGAATVDRPKTMSSQDIDHELARLRADEYTRQGIIAHERYGWERRRKRMEREGDYARVRDTLEHLRHHETDTYRGVLRREHWALERLANRVPGSIRVPLDIDAAIGQQLVDDAHSLRDRGVPVTVIAELLYVKEHRARRLLKMKPSRPAAAVV